MDFKAIIHTAKVVNEAAPQLKKLKQASEDMEAVFFKDMLAAMRRSVPKSSLEGSMPGKEIFQDMLDQSLAQTGAKTGAFGIGKLLFKQFAKSATAEAEARLRMHASLSDQTI